MRYNYDKLIWLLFALLAAQPLFAESNYISPLDFGLREAKNGVERYRALYRCHNYAALKNVRICYEGIRSISIEIPEDFKPLPVSDDTDFSCVEINVLNQSKDGVLFMMRNVDSTYISLNGSQLYKDSKILQSEKNGILIVYDKTPWVEERKGHGYSVTRADIFIVEKGKLKNNPIYDYNSPDSRPMSYFTRATSTKKSFRNLVFNRDSRSSFKTNLLKVEGQYNVEISNIIITTPSNSNLVDDRIIRLENDCLITLRNVKFNGTYSRKSHSGYGVYINNVYDLKINDLYARANWGIFGNNNLNKVLLENSDINRMDIHCYGRDVQCVNCKFSNLYNQFSSVYGEINFKNCTFINFIPILMESSYNAYTPFELVFENCIFNLTSKKNFIITLSGLESSQNSRKELSRKSLPNINIKNCKVNMMEDVGNWYIVHTGKVSYKETLDYISRINIDGLRVNKPSDFDIFTEELHTTNYLQVSINQMYTIYNEQRIKYKMPIATVDQNAKVMCNGEKVSRKTNVTTPYGILLPMIVGGALFATCRYKKH